MRWMVVDSLYCPEQFFCSHLDATSHYLREAGEQVDTACLNLPGVPGVTYREGDAFRQYDIMFAMDRYDRVASWHVFAEGQNVLRRRPALIAQVAAICDPLPWNVRKPDGSPAYDLIISSIPWMVDEARAKGCRAEYMPLAFDTRARVCGMGVKRDLDCIFIGSVGPNHKRRTELLRELADVVTVLPPVFGRDYFATLARAKVVFNVHAEWARGAANNMRIFEAGGMGCEVVSDGDIPGGAPDRSLFHGYDDGFTPREMIVSALREATSRSFLEDDHVGKVLHHHTYESRIPRLIELARSL